MSTIRVNNILDASGGSEATLNGVMLKQGMVDNENRVINGAFDFWQRGTNFDTGTYLGYTADRWVLSRVGGNASIARGTFPLGTTFGSNNPVFYLTYGVANQSAVSDVSYFEQRIEDVRNYAGQTITVMGWARRIFGSGNISLSMIQYFGTGGSPSTAVQASNAQIISLTTSWQPFALTFTMPSVSGKTLGTNGDHAVYLRIFGSAGSNFNSQSGNLGIQTISADLWGIHIRPGTHTTASVGFYKEPELAQELIRCQRYYEKSYEIATAPATATAVGATEYYHPGSASGAGLLSFEFKVTKRVAPTLTVYSPSGAGGAMRDVSVTADRTVTIRTSNIRSASIISAVATNNAIHQAHFTADAEL